MAEKGVKAEVVVYQASDGALQIEDRLAQETIWLPMADVAKLFE